MAKNSKSVLCWHFADPIEENKSVRLGNFDHRTHSVGKTLKMKSVFGDNGTPRLCQQGMHGSRRIHDALLYTIHGWVLCLVEISGDIVEGEDKLVGRRRKLIAVSNLTANDFYNLGDDSEHRFRQKAKRAMKLTQLPDTKRGE